jgi:hypothetical protein
MSSDYLRQAAALLPKVAPLIKDEMAAYGGDSPEIVVRHRRPICAQQLTWP